MLLIVTTAFLLLYTTLIFFYFYHWVHIKESSLDNASRVFISVVVAARNEEKNVVRLLEALEKQTYSQNFFEVIVVDDFSTDRTAEKIEALLNDRVHLTQPIA